MMRGFEEFNPFCEENIFPLGNVLSTYAKKFLLPSHSPRNNEYIDVPRGKIKQFCFVDE
jgi:hypothetical protein